MIERNIKLFKWDNFFAGLWPLSTLVIIYFQQITNSYAMAMAIFSVSSLTTTLMELPTGKREDDKMSHLIDDLEKKFGKNVIKYGG